MALVDVLGQGAVLEDIESLWERDAMAPETHEAIKRSARTVEFVRESLIEQVKGWSSRRESTRAAALPENERKELAEVRNVKFQSFAFSDTVGLYASLGNDKGQLRMTAIYGILAGCATTMLTSLGAGVPLRGAVEIGLGYELPSGGLYGPAMVRSHHLESKIAGWPRVLIGPRLFALAGFRASHQATTKREKVEVFGAKECLKLFHQCSDGQIMIDFLGLPILEAARRVPGFAVVESGIRSHLESQKCKAAQAGNVLLAGRYAMLTEYVQTRLQTAGV